MEKVTSFGKVIATFVIVVSSVYLINPTAGVFELLPDALPVVGNIDEGLAAFMIYAAINYLRTGVILWPNKK